MRMQSVGVFTSSGIWSLEAENIRKWGKNSQFITISILHAPFFSRCKYT